jgi:peptide/nickel transport system substrate-binding protein
MRPIQWARQTQGEKFNHDFRKFVYMTPGFSYIGWNLRSPYFKDARVRLAMSHMVDKQKIIDKINFGLGKTVTGPFFPFADQYNKDLSGILYNRDKAKELLDQAGWRDTNGDGWLDKDGVTFSFTFLYPSAAKITERVSTILKEDLKKMGINMKIDRLEWAAFLEKLKKYEFDATALGWSSGFQMDPYQIFHSSQAQVAGGSNYVGFMNQRADQIMERARVEFDEAKRNQMYREFHKILYEEQPYTFLYVSPKLSAVSRHFDNVIVHKAGLDIMDWKIKMSD